MTTTISNPCLCHIYSVLVTIRWVIFSYLSNSFTVNRSRLKGWLIFRELFLFHPLSPAKFLQNSTLMLVETAFSETLEARGMTSHLNSQENCANSDKQAWSRFEFCSNHVLRNMNTNPTPIPPFTFVFFHLKNKPERSRTSTFPSHVMTNYTRKDFIWLKKSY